MTAMNMTTTNNESSKKVKAIKIIKESARATAIIIEVTFKVITGTV